ncbi:MAG: hypothetical protein HYW07_22730 [Candidatus Latescibacteria bacterium]|nr:hypothetical protein [Candidatus Latescibacterota bacterium]
MAAEQTLSELTIRDVLLQVDRRLTLIEGDLRNLDSRFTARVDALDAKFDNRIDNRFQWTVGIVLASWITLMIALLLK